MSKPKSNLIVGLDLAGKGKVTVKEIKVKIGAWISKGQIIAVLLSENSSIPLRVKAEDSGKVVEILTKASSEVTKM